MPVGMVVAFAGNEIPNKWELCDGRMVSKDVGKWKKLFEAIGAIHGGDGNPMFKLPDYRGRFLRGVSDGTNRDPDAPRRQAPGDNNTGNSGDLVGSIQDDALESHTHIPQVHDPGHSHGYKDHAQPASNTFDAGGGRGLQDHQRTTDSAGTGISVTIAPFGGLETRPINAAVKWIICIAD